MTESPLASIYREIEQALAANLYYLAIAVTVSLPDICATLEGKAPTNWETYKTWFRDNAAKRFTNFGEHECYELRCGVVHNARLMGGKDKRSGFDKIVFTPPSSPFKIHDSVSRDNSGIKESALLMDTVSFCSEMIDAAREWETTHASNPVVRANMEHIVRLRPNGVSPHIVGIPVVA